MRVQVKISTMRFEYSANFIFELCDANVNILQWNDFKPVANARGFTNFPVLFGFCSLGWLDI